MAPSWHLAPAGGLAKLLPRPRSNRLQVLGNIQYSCYQHIITIAIDVYVYIV